MGSGLTYCPGCLRVVCICARMRPLLRVARPWGACGGEAREHDGRRHPEPGRPPDPLRAA